MIAFCFKQRSLLYNGFALNLRNSSILELGDVRILPIKFFSSKRKSISLVEDDKQQQKHSFEVSYLTHSCGLTPETALSVSKRVHFESSKGPDSVLALLRKYGFENAHISRLIGKYPKLLVANPEKTLMPKLDFFSSIGILGSELPKVLCSSPRLLECNLERRLVPTYNFLKSIVGHDTKITTLLSQSWWIPGFNVQRAILPNVALLKELGAPQSIIVNLVSSYIPILSRNKEHFGAKVKEVIGMGFDPTKTRFIHALVATNQMTKSTWQHKVGVYKKWGWSDTDINLAFRMHPLCMCLSEMKIQNVMNFLVKKMGFQSTAIARKPFILSYSLEKRITPRCLVVRFLLLKGLLKKIFCIRTYLDLSEKQFLDKYVTVYQEQFPEILGVYQGKANLIELGIGGSELKI